MGSTSSIVISFSIAILLLLILLLLLSYNSKCKVDKVERFVDDAAPFNLGGYNERFADMVSNTQAPAAEVPQPPKRSSVANNDPYILKTDDLNMNTKAQQLDFIHPYDATTSLCDVSQVNGVETFANPNETIDPTSCFKRDRLTKDDLLPKDANLKWAQINPSSAGDITDKNFLTAGYHVGINTVGQSLRNANLQLRSEIPNPQVAVSPWMISTIEPDLRPVSFEIGSSPSSC